MNETTKISKDPRRFSTGWCLGAAVFHFVATVALAGISFVTAMGAFTKDVSSEVAFWRGIQWLWTPLAMAAWDPHKGLDTGLIVGLAFLWSCIIGVLVGLFIPAFRRWLHMPRNPSATHNDDIRNA